MSGSATDNAWGQGDKSDCYLAKTGGVAGACVTQVFGIGASKTDLQYHGIGLAQATASDGTLHSYLYSGIKRLLASGISSSNANYAVEVNQLLPAYQPAAPICTGTVAASGDSCNMWRSPGDLIFMTDWGGNSSSCNTATPAICAYIWIDPSTGTNPITGVTKTPNSGTCFSAKVAPCWGTTSTFTNPALSANPDLAAGSIDSSTSTFSEIGVDLTKANLVPSGSCETFNNVWAHSRSSSSFTAELKDFIFGNVSISTCSGVTTKLHERTDINGGGDIQSGSEISIQVGAFVNDVATVTPASATGSVDFRYYGTLDACKADAAGTAGTDVSSNAVSGGSSTSSTVQFNSVGDFYWRAFYSGGGLLSSASPCDEILHVAKASPALTTTASGPVTVGATITDTAHLTGGFGTLTGTISFQVFGPADTTCSTPLATIAATAAVTGAGNYTSGTYTTAAVGTYRWEATFTDTDGNNNSVGPTACGADGESSTVNPGSPSFTTAMKLLPNDSATLSGIVLGGSASGTNTQRIIFNLFDNATCSGTAIDTESFAATANTTYSTNNLTHFVSVDGTWSWLVSYTGDSYNNPFSPVCTTEQFKVDFTPLAP